LSTILNILVLSLGLEVEGGNNQQAQQQAFFLNFDYSPLHMYAEAKDYQVAFNREYPAIAIIFIFLNAYIVAALCEEITKYMGYDMIRHPDFLSDDELISGSDAKEDISSSNRSLVPSPQRNAVTVGNATTVAMVSVALGFACCENLVYIFVYNNHSLQMQIVVLIARSLFPVHPLCAAIQSISVCQQKLENIRSMTFGRIIFPAVVLHGTYDLVIMYLTFLLSIEEFEDADDANAAIMRFNSMAICSSFIIVILGFFYYAHQSRRQSYRLAHLNQQKTPMV